MFIFGYKLPYKTRFFISLQYCFGIGFTNSIKLYSKLGLNNNDKKSIVKFNFTNFESLIYFLIRRILKRNVGVFLKNIIFIKLRDFKNLRTLKSIKHSLFLPVRGQKSKYNAQTQKSKRKGRRKLPIAKKKKK